jgi:hypothetical protein
MSRDPKKNLQTLNEYVHRQDEEQDILKSFRSAGVAGVIMLVGFVGVIGLFMYLDATSTEATQAQSNLEQEFQMVVPPPSVFQQEYHATRKMQSAFVIGVYRSSLSYTEIRDSYHTQLLLLGWKFVTEAPSSPPEGDDPGRRVLSYRKGKNKATLEYEGNNANAGYTYAFSLRWQYDNF